LIDTSLTISINKQNRNNLLIIIFFDPAMTLQNDQRSLFEGALPGFMRLYLCKTISNVAKPNFAMILTYYKFEGNFGKFSSFQFLLA